MPPGMRIVLAAALALVLGALPFLLDSYVQYVINLALAYVVITLGLNLVLGFAGQISFGSAAFMAVGAYATSLLVARLDVPFLLALPIGALGTAMVGYLGGLPAVRVRELY